MDVNDNESTVINNSYDFDISKKIAYPDIKSLVRLFFMLIAYMIIGGIILGIFLFESKSLNLQLSKPLLNLFFYIVTLLATIRYAFKKNKKQQPSAFNVSFNKIRGWIVPVIIISTLALVVGLEGISNLIPMPQSVQKFFESAFTKDTFSIVNIIIAAPILEEILCRGIVLKGLLKNYSPEKAIVISAIFFSLIHLNPWQALPAFFGGLFLGWVFYKTRSVIPGMIIHFTINATASAFMFFPKQQQGFLSLLGEPYYIVLCIFSALVFVFGCLLIEKKYSIPNAVVNY